MFTYTFFCTLIHTILSCFSCTDITSYLILIGISFHRIPKFVGLWHCIYSFWVLYIHVCSKLTVSFVVAYHLYEAWHMCVGVLFYLLFLAFSLVFPFKLRDACLYKEQTEIAYEIYKVKKGKGRGGVGEHYTYY
jgi:hypothetical protein